MKEEDIPESEQVVKDRLSEKEKLRLEAERVAEYTEEEQEKYYIKKARRAAEKMQRQSATTVREWIRAQSDSLVIASHYDPEPVLLALLPYLKCSRPFVVYCD
ncbi:hypothetical protein P43SY_011138 [Pythium insidiosum]|uniref:tRNA (adenine(58)-N(1))-methyltransferase non-catalytic subunit TRM6 n=1 Tax=Pythium insidiosum TaxID=114742 RepID=A0AAD5Q008_PYTIN|nr:hypothetical protein P43SY_011138 [Pythium insidiosum]